MKHAPVTLLALTMLTIGLHAQQPAAPASLVATVTGTTVSLQWQPSPGGAAVQYVIEVGSTPGASNVGRFNVGSATSIVANSVAAGTLYVRIRASAGGVDSAPSNEVAFTVGASCASAPGAPGALSSTVDGTSVQLSWGPASGVSTYVLEVGSTMGASNLATFDLGTTNTSYRAAGVASGTYFLRVRGRNACGLGPPSTDTVVVVGQVPSGPARIEIVNVREYTIVGGSYGGDVAFVAEVVNTGGTTASKVTRDVEVFKPDGSRYFGTFAEVSGRTRRVLSSNQLGHSTLAPGESGCISERLGPRSTLGRYTVRMNVETEPTAPALGQLQVQGTWYANSTFGLVVTASMTNIGQIRTVENEAVFMAKDAAGRVVTCGSITVQGSTRTTFPGFVGTVSQLLPGERSSSPTTAYYDWPNSQSIASITFWPRWRE
jgi:acyl-coenzyme A thioesterase PaaI-like protein